MTTIRSVIQNAPPPGNKPSQACARCSTPQRRIFHHGLRQCE